MKKADSLAKGKSKAGFLHGLRKQLVFDGQITDPQTVARDESLHRARSVLNFEGRSILLVSRRSL